MFKKPGLMIAVSLMAVLLDPSSVTAKVKVANYATVATSGGDYDSPIEAMGDLDAWCENPSAASPCLLKIMPGTYDLGAESLVMEEFVDIEGSGENVTKLVGDKTTITESPEGLVIGASFAELRFLSVVNEATGTGDAAAITYNITNLQTAAPKMLHVTASASGGSDRNIGVYLNCGAVPPHPARVSAVTASASGGNSSYGIQIVDCKPALRDVLAEAGGASQESYGVFDNNDAGPATTIENSVLSGIDGALFSKGFGSARIAGTRLIGGVASEDDGDPPPVCAGVYDAAFKFYASTCPAPSPS